MSGMAFVGVFFYLRTFTFSALMNRVTGLVLVFSVFFSGFTAGASADRSSVGMPLAWLVLWDMLVAVNIDLVAITGYLNPPPKTVKP